MCDFHSQSQGMCWYFRTALETLSTQIEGEWSASRAKRDYWTFWSQNLTVDLHRIYLTTRDLTSWSQPYRDDKCTKQLYSVWILPVNYKRIMNRRTQNRPTCWQLASEVDPHGPSCAVPSGLRFWLAVDHRTNDSSSVCGICEAYYISTRCESLYPKCNRISSNKSMNMTPYSPIPRRQRHFVDGQRTRMTQLTKDFAMRHDENYVEWNGISIKLYQFVTNCPYHQTIFQE